MKIAFLLVKHTRERESPIMREVFRLLAQRGAEVDLLYPDEGIIDLARVRVEHDLYVLKSAARRRSASPTRHAAAKLADAIDACAARHPRRVGLKRQVRTPAAPLRGAPNGRIHDFRPVFALTADEPVTRQDAQRARGGAALVR